MYADVNGTRIFFDIDGTGWKKEGDKLVDKPVCFVLHGGPGGTHLGFRPHFSQLNETIQLVYIDNRGSGFSDRGPQKSYTIENNVDDIEALRKYLGLKKIYLLGHSYGGMVAMSYAIKYQNNLNGMLLLTTSPSSSFIEKAKDFVEMNGTEEQKEIANVLWDGAFQSLDHVAKYYQVMGPLYSRKQSNDTQPQAAALGHRSYQALNEGFGNFLRAFDIRDQLETIFVPTLVMAGRYDWITPVEESEQIASLIPNSRLIVFENSSHNVHVDETEKFFETVLTFINYTGGKKMNKVDSLQGFEETAQKLVEKYHIPGTSVALAKDGEVIYQKSFGFRNVENGYPINEDTVFGIGSITKSFTCVAIMQLQEQGKLHVHDAVIQYLPEFRLKDSSTVKEMTIHHFMTHSAGIPPLSTLYYAMKRTMEIDPSVKDYKSLLVDEKEADYIDMYDQLMDFIASEDVELLGNPGKHFSYSNDSYALLGCIIERVSGKSYEQYVYDHILKPCGMNRSFFTIDEYGADDNVSMSYAIELVDDRERVYEAPIWWDAPAMRAAGFLKSTAKDMLKYAEIFRNGGVVNDKRILNESSVNEMMKHQIEIQPGKFYGYGLMITEDYFGTKLVEHGGNLKAIAAQMSILPEEGITGVTLTNLAGVPASRIMELALNDIQGRDPNASHMDLEEVDLPLEIIEKYVGDYVSNEGTKVLIGIENEKLTFTYRGSVYPIKPVGENLFLAQVNDLLELLQIHRDENGNAVSITCHYRKFPKVISKQLTKEIQG
ncbi:alpha/beta fold hydrolase [Bacillus litorisediminis]|uniref:alpha/beta fold hydrolase n=1 Tax=Bacillus litorisediminis TaxID=2922713 RepID=UPI001FAEFDDF|nr:alpha/beta fold hydrolase [Bacillus litorisediminis]